MKECGTLIIGAGITGLAIARELLARGEDDILIIEKEPGLGYHGSGRNSGVLHAGVYYSAGTLKARFCAIGNQLMREYCKSKGLTLIESGKVIVATDEAEELVLDELKQRADSSGAVAEIIDADRLKELEPHARTHRRALHSPNTAVIRPMEVLSSLHKDLEDSGRVRFSMATGFVGFDSDRSITTSTGPIRFRRLVNAAGAFADVVAHKAGIGTDYKSVPFKGTYKRVVEPKEHLVRGNIYPVPDLRNPFLGVHLSRTGDGHVYAGPTAIPAFGRENYGILRGVSKESPKIVYRDAVLLARNQGFRFAALTEPRKYVTRVVLAEARKLVPELQPGDLESADKVGIRPQLVHWPTKTLVMDYVVKREGDSVHVLNAISPAFTSAFAFAEHVGDILDGSAGED